MKTDRELLEEILKALSRIELSLSSSSESDNSEGNYKQPAHRSTIAGKADMGRLIKNRRFTLPLPPETAKSVRGAVRNMEFGDRHEMVIPIGVDPKLVVESVRYLGEQTGKAKDFLITSENGIVSILRTK